MTTPTPLQTEPRPPVPTLSPDAPAAMTAQELESYGRMVSPQSGLRRARALDDADAPPQAGPRDLTGIHAAMTTAESSQAQAYYWGQPDWHAILDIRQQVDDVLARLNEQAETRPQTGIHAAKITTLAASLIARHAAKVTAVLNAGGQRDTPGGQAMRTLTRVAEDHAARASGLESVQSLDTPRLLIAHMHKLTKELRRAEASQEPAQDPGVDDPDDPELDSALSVGAAADPELAEASQLMNALSELGGRARRAGHRLTLDVRLHGMVETAQLRGFEMISGIAQAMMRRYDNQDRSTDGRRNIAAMIFHYAEQRLERMRGTLGADEQHDFGHYETDPPKRYMDALYDESRTVVAELRAKYLTREDRTDLQIRFLLAQREIAAALGDDEWGIRGHAPRTDVVAGMQTDTPVETRTDLIDALRRRVEGNPFHHDAQFLNKVADRFAAEIAGPAELTPEAVNAVITVAQVESVARSLVDEDTIASPLVLSDKAELNLTHAQAERALDLLQTMNVVGPHKGLKPRETLFVSSNHLSNQWPLLEQQLLNLLELQKGAAAISASTAPVTPAPAAQPEAAPAAEAPMVAEPEPEPEPEQAPAPVAPSQPAPAEPAPAAAAPELPRRDRSAERRHPGNLRSRPAPAAETSADQDLAKLLEGAEDQIKEVSQNVINSKEVRAAVHPAPAEAAPVKATHADEAQHNAQQTQQTAAVGVR
ncbi:hypothetical protein [Streptomyces sp. NPDC056304]|uniref:hypothetical protein n=1 Tax=Streptomyces sp. NPDC056304 TaxID=3345778 RepID=UPI0035DB57A1